MAYGYVIAQSNVTYPQSHPTFVAKSPPPLDEFTGPSRARTSITWFPPFDAAQNRYTSHIYSEAKGFRQPASTSVQTIMEEIK